MADAEPTAIEQLAKALGIVATGHRMPLNQTACKELETALIRFVSEKCPPSVSTTAAYEPKADAGLLSDADLKVIREWLLTEKDRMKAFTTVNMEYPCSIAVNHCEMLLDEVTRLRGGK